MQQPKIGYHVRMDNPAAHFFQMEIHVSNLHEEQVELSLPVWTPGSYLIREYSKNIDAVTAQTINGDHLQVNKIAKNKWLVNSSKNDFIVQYHVYAFEESVRTCWLDDDHASIIPAGLFLYLEKYDLPVTIQFYPPGNWQAISTALESIEGNKWKRSAPNRDTLFDSPVEIGNHEIYSFHAAGVTHELAIYGAGNYSVEKILRDMSKIVAEEVKIFKQHPCKNYLFILLNSNSMRGGLEHLHSTSLIFKRFNYEPESNYTEFISLVAHEYFHLWNVKRLRPFALGPFDYSNENYTTSLWIAEGFTSYYDDLIIRRCNLISERSYLDIVEKNINDALNPPGDAIHPVADASLDAWIKYYRQNENSPNTQVNYYVKGGVLALLLDLIIIKNSDCKNCLDDVMAEAYDLFYLKRNQGYKEDEFKLIIEKYAKEDLGWFYTDHVYGTKRVELKKYFELFGVDLQDLNENEIEPDLGIVINEKNIISQIRKNSAGEKSGLNVNDEILAINDFRYSQNFLQTITVGKKAGDQLKLTVSRNGIIKVITVTIQITDKANFKLTLNQHATEAQKKLFGKWIG